jgi:hypothetical protein
VDPAISALLAAAFVPLIFWLFDTLVKQLGSIPTDDVGADLCLVAVSFNSTTLLTALVSTATGSNQATRDGLVGLTSASLGASLILYVFALILIAPPGPLPLPALLRWLKAKTWKTILAVVLGFLALSSEVGLYTWMLLK